MEQGQSWDTVQFHSVQISCWDMVRARVQHSSSLVPSPYFSREARASPYAGKRGTGNEAKHSSSQILHSTIDLIDYVYVVYKIYDYTAVSARPSCKFCMPIVRALIK